jgi:hypothetical protein
MDRNGEDWTGDQIEARASGDAAGAGGDDNRAEAHGSTEDSAPRRRSVGTAAEKSVTLNDDGAATVTSAGSGAAGGSD